MKKYTWGGARPGSGRKMTGRKTRSVYVTETEFAKVRALIYALREQKSGGGKEK